MAMFLVRNWWSLVIRGVVAVVFGLITLFSPGLSLASLIIAFGIYALVDGVFGIFGAIRGATQHGRWGWELFEALVSVAAGVFALARPGLTALALLLLIAARAIVNGILEIAAAIRLRKLIRGEWMLGLAGALSIAFGIILMAAPGPGALAVALWIGIYAIAVGVFLIGQGLRLRKRAHRPVEPPITRAAVPV